MNRLLIIIGLALMPSLLFAAKPVDFTLQSLEGKVQRLSDYQGKWVLVNYWATWCPPCLDEIPELEAFHQAHAKTGKAVVLGVDMEDISLSRLKDFVDDQFISYPILLAGAEGKGMLDDIPGLPTSFLIHPNGRIVAKQVGPVTEKGISQFIEKYEARLAKSK